MEYMVIGPDGQEYGPANVATLKEWVAQARLQPESQLKNFATGAIVSARDVPDLFQAAMPTQMTTQSAGYAPPMTTGYPGSTGASASDDMRPLWGILGRCAGAIILCFILRGIAILLAVYAIYYAVQLKSSGSKYGVLALILSGITAIIVGTVLYLRFIN